jgi:hypothetical protein
VRAKGRWDRRSALSHRCVRGCCCCCLRCVPSVVFVLAFGVVWRGRWEERWADGNALASTKDVRKEQSKAGRAASTSSKTPVSVAGGEAQGQVHRHHRQSVLRASFASRGRLCSEFLEERCRRHHKGKDKKIEKNSPHPYRHRRYTPLSPHPRAPLTCPSAAPSPFPAPHRLALTATLALTRFVLGRLFTLRRELVIPPSSFYSNWYRRWR